MENKDITLEGLIEGDELDSAYRKRNKNWITKKIVPQDITSFINDGWEVRKKTKKTITLRKPKDIGSAFEDDVWCIFYKMGFLEMNGDNTFKIPRYKTNLDKQIDVFARDDQCFCLVECKAAEKPHTKKSLDKDIDQIKGTWYQLEQSVFSHYKNIGNGSKFKATRILALKNIDLSENDIERANEANIKILDESMINYYSALASHFGMSAKYQLLADLFPGIEIPELIEPVPAIRGKMGDTTFYSFVIEPEKLLKIAYISHRAKTNEDSIDTYQRMAKKRRLKKIAEYIHDRKGIFPTSIVLNIQNEKCDPIRFDPAKDMAGKNAVLGTLYIPNKFKTAWVIDGQHRLFAYSDLEESKTATLPVIAFENLEPERQSQLFVDINGEQVKVPKSHLADLYTNLHWGSDNPREQLLALASRLIKELNDWTKSPFRDRIIGVNGKTDEYQSVTIAALSDEIRKRQFFGSVKSKKDKFITPGPFYICDMETSLTRAKEIISGFVNNYIENNENLKRQWEIGSGEGGYICTNSGVIAQLRVLNAILDHLENNDNVDIKKLKTQELLDKMWQYQEPVCSFLGNATPKLIQDFRSQHGEGGFRACSYALLNEIHKNNKQFNPHGLRQWIESQNTTNNPKAYDLIASIEKMIMNHVVNTLKEEFGNGLEQWWHKGLPKSVSEDAMSRANKAGEYKYPEKYLSFIDWKDIINNNFDLFEEVFTIDAKKHDSKKKKLEWFIKVNDIRNICMHPPRGGVSDNQLEMIIEIHTTIQSRLDELEG